MPEKPPNLPEDMSDLINDPDSLRTREERIRGIVEDEELGRKLREPVDEDDIGRQEEKIYQIPRAERAEFCRKLLAEYQERCRRQIAVLEKVKDDPGKAELLDHWRDISAKMEKGDVSSYLAELEKRMKSQLSELYDVMEQLQQEENKAAKVGLNNRKENILQVINRLMKSERNL